jgi:hypothetical protein
MRYIFSPQCHPQIPRKSRKKITNEAAISLKTHKEKMCEIGLANMLMKTRHLEAAGQYVDENKGGYPALRTPTIAGTSRIGRHSPLLGETNSQRETHHGTDIFKGAGSSAARPASKLAFDCRDED